MWNVWLASDSDVTADVFTTVGYEIRVLVSSETCSKK